ncbi:MAG: hypothetical protein K8R54_12135 [Bacteroidales bacterium]|nr:hypothetical protein [Bacteroidales bacterium]
MLHFATRSFFYFLILIVIINLSVSAQVVQVFKENFNIVDLKKIPEKWTCEGDGWGVVSEDKEEYYFASEYLAVSNLTNLKLRESFSGKRMLYCAINEKFYTYSLITKRLHYQANFDTKLKTPWFNESKKLDTCVFSFYYLIPSIVGDPVGKRNDYFKVLFETEDGNNIELFHKDSKVKKWTKSDVIDLTEYIDELKFRIVFWFHSDNRDTEEGVYIDDFYMQYKESNSLKILNMSSNSQIVAGRSEKIKWKSNYESKIQISINLWNGGTIHTFYPNEKSKIGLNEYTIKIPKEIGGKHIDFCFEIRDINNPEVSYKSENFKILKPAKLVLSSKSKGWNENPGSSHTLDFGDVIIGRSNEKEITITNEGEVDVSVKLQSIYDNGECTDCFQFEKGIENDFTLGPEERKTIKFYYFPSLENRQFRSLIVNGNKTGDVVMFLGKGKLASDIQITQSSEKFGFVEIGKTKKLKFLFRNYGDSEQKVNVKLVGSSAFSFTDTNSEKSFTLKPFDKRIGSDNINYYARNIEISFKPIQEKLYKAEILFEANSRKLSLPIDGYGQKIDNEVAVDEFLYEYGVPEEKITKSFTELNSDSRIFFPNSSSEIEKGENIEISWKFYSEGNIKIDLYNGNSFIKSFGLISKDSKQCNFYDLPNNIGVSENYRIRLTDSKNKENYIQSENFSVINKKNISKDNYSKSYNFSYVRKTFEGKPVNYIKTITVNSRYLTISAYDHRLVDGDIVSLILNGETILSGHTLTAGKKRISVELKEDQENVILLYAHNTGYSGPNTVALLIEGGGTRNQIVLESTMQSCEGLIIKVLN